MCQTFQFHILKIDLLYDCQLRDHSEVYDKLLRPMI